MEFVESLKQIAGGLIGTAFLALFVSGFTNGQRPQGPVILMLLLGLASLFGPYLLLSGLKQLITWLVRRQQFCALDRRGKTEEINQLVAKLYRTEERAPGVK